MTATRIGIYGGTFDPVHLGHLAVVEAVREAAALDQVLWVPNSRQPLKEDGPWATGEQRLRMVRAAIEGNTAFAVSEIELRQAGPSYTVETLDALRHDLPGADLHFIMGADAANALGDWREPARLLGEYRPIVMSRAGWPDVDWPGIERLHSDARSLIMLVNVPQLEIDSHTLRKRIAAGRSIRYLIPEGAREIIEREKLYRPAEPA